MTHTTPPPPVADRLIAWVERYQAEAWAFDADVEQACAALVRMAKAAPRGLPASQQQVVCRALNDAWRRVLVLVAIDAPADSSSVTPPPAMSADWRATKLLSELDRRYADPRLKLVTLARQIAVSPSHLTQILKNATGRTFGAHLHTRRVAEARRLLVASTLSVKEIASRVGYSTTTQLDRHFRKIVCRPPTVYRESARLTYEWGQADGDVPRARYGPSPTHPPTHPQK